MDDKKYWAIKWTDYTNKRLKIRMFIAILIVTEQFVAKGSREPRVAT